MVKNLTLIGKTYEEIYGSKEEAKRQVEKRRIANRGKIRSEEQNRRMSIACKGKVVSKETRRKISITCKGKVVSKETRRKISIARLKRKKELGYFNSSETRIKMSIAKKGNKLSEEAKRKQSAGHQEINIKDWKKFIDREPYDQRWTNIFKRRIRKRDNQICMVCLKHGEKLKKTLHIHHINYNKQCTIPQNCISLCFNCHAKTNNNRKYWIQFFQNLLSEKYEYSYAEKGEVILQLKEEYCGLRY